MCVCSAKYIYISKSVCVCVCLRTNIIPLIPEIPYYITLAPTLSSIKRKKEKNEDEAKNTKYIELCIASPKVTRCCRGVVWLDREQKSFKIQSSPHHIQSFTTPRTALEKNFY